MPLSDKTTPHAEPNSIYSRGRTESTSSAGSRSKTPILISLLVAGSLTCRIDTAQSTPVQSGVAAVQALSTSLVYPLMGPRESSSYGIRKHPLRKRVSHHHAGIDLAAPRGAIIRAIASGRVMYSDPHGGYGNFIVIRHPNGLTSHYGHCDTLKVQVGQSVTAGQVIATVGSTGASTGPHLHFEIRRDGQPQNPERYLPGLEAPSEG
jgi:murein DD-endopeptidase MepM/ murein hydrolase activator NlpD